MKKRIIGLALILHILIMFIPNVSAINDIKYIDYLYYTINSNSEITITGCDYSTSEVIIPNEIDNLPVTIIGNGAFENCEMTSVIIPDSIEIIGDDAFRNCLGLKNITMGKGVKIIGANAFRRMGGGGSGSNIIPKNLYISDITSWCKIDFRNGYSNPFCYTNNLYINGKLMTNIIIPNDVISIGKYTFYSSNIKGIVIPDSVSIIGEYSFAKCYYLENIILPNSVTNIGDSAFESCINLNNVRLGNGIESINVDTFYNCESIRTIIIPKSIIRVESNAFRGCFNLSVIEYGGTKSDWDKVYIDVNNESLKKAKINYNSSLAPTPNPTPIPIITAEITKTEMDDSYNFKIDTPISYENCYVYAAVYDNGGILLSVNCQPLALEGNTNISVKKSENDAFAKIFVFSKTLQPLTETAKEFNLTE
ncbi:leucine-rich repeat domain-containing protein [Lachnospiraceae bacterium MD329]|nr:leucine-rich repeat domain-containing protein [Lachnospiraceae bacterium MD329]